MRDLIWRAALKNHPEGQILTLPLLALRVILFPLDFFYWRMSETRGYCWRSNTWNIHGVKYTDAALRALADAQGEVFKVTRSGECVTLERIDR